MREGLDRAAVLAACATLLSACAPNYYNNRLTDIVYGGQQRDASIQVSDPQLYKRESLLNERREETEYLNDLLSKSRSVEFTPELARDIESVSALSAQLGLSFDPAAKLQFNRSVELSDLEQQIAVTKLQTQLAQLRRDLELTQTALASQTASSGAAGSAASSTALAPIKPPGLDAAKEIATRLEGALKTLTDRLDKQSVGPRRTSATSSPRELFQDRQAYRREIQSALNSTALDELHDFEANSLFRFQFRATALPAKPDNADSELGVLQMQLERPTLDPANPTDVEQVRMLYLEWLDHASHRLNEVVDESTVRPDPALLQLGAEGKLFSLLSIVIPRGDDDKDCRLAFVVGDARAAAKCVVVRAAVPPIPSSAGSARDSLASFAAKAPAADREGKQISFLGLRVQSFLNAAQTLTISEACAELEKIPNWNTLFSAFLTTGANSARLQRASSALIGQVNRLSTESVGSLNTVIVDIATFLRAVEALQSRADYTGECGIGVTRSADFSVPEQFTKALFEEKAIVSEKKKGTPATSTETQRGGSSGAAATTSATGAATGATSPSAEGKTPSKMLIARGRISTYAVSPVALAQRVSSVARVADALQLAASLAATVPSSGVGGSLGVGYMRSVTGKVDAIERIPLVIGYSGYTGDAAAPRASGFGWLLGPRVVLDPERKALALEHNLAPYDLTADISMPGWWPYVDFHVKSAWAPNWQKQRGQVMTTDDKSERAIRLKMRHSRGDLDGITTLVLQGQGGPRVQTASIGNVEPRTVSDCASDVTFLVRGTNIWRARDAYLQGQPGQSITVLPDMAGISVKFNVDKLLGGSGDGLLVIATPDGLATTNIAIRGDRSNKCAPPPPEGAGPLVAQLFPKTMYACQNPTRFIARGKNLTGATAYLGSLAGQVTVSDEGRQMEVLFNRAIGTEGGASATMPLVIAGAKGATSVDVTIERDDCAAPAPAAQPPALTAMPNGTLNLCANEAVVLATGGGAPKIDGAKISSITPALDLSAQSIKLLPNARAAELSFPGLAKGTLPEGFSGPVKVTALSSGRVIASVDLRAACGAPAKTAGQ
jgi:hypothetical protein